MDASKVPQIQVQPIFFSPGCEGCVIVGLVHAQGTVASKSTRNNCPGKVLDDESLDY